MFSLLFALPILLRSMLASTAAPIGPSGSPPPPPSAPPSPLPAYNDPTARQAISAVEQAQRSATSAPPTPPAPTPPADRGYPENTPVAEMTDAQQAAYWRHYARQHEERNKARADYDDLKAKADELERLKKSQMSDQDKAVDEAKKQARAEALREAAGKMVDVHLAAAVTAGRLTQERADVLLDGLDRTRYLTPAGDVDTDKVKALLDTVAPATGNGRTVDLGQGRRKGNVKPSVAAGRELFEARRPKKAS